MIELGVNIDHVATIRQARKTNEPDPIWAAALAELGGADAITVHLREDRRHIQDRDVRILKETCKARLNLEMACASEILDIAVNIVPDQATLVPEKREEITTEGGLDIIGNRESVQRTIERLKEAGVHVSLFLDPDLEQIDMAEKLGADAVELHTGQYALARTDDAIWRELEALKKASAKIHSCGMRLHAGHGLTYHNVLPIAQIEGMDELNIGHSIISRAVMVGMQQAVREMKDLIRS